MVRDGHQLRLLQIPPPIHPEDPDSPLPETILLDAFGYLSDRTNATTANGRRSRTKKKGKRILVTFWPAAPPRVSCFTVHCPDLKPDAYGSIPKVCYTVDGLALLRITICPVRQNMYPKNIRYFVYQAGDKTPPSVKLVHSPPDFTFFDREVALLRRRDQDTFFIAVLRRAYIDREYTDGHFNLHLYSSRTKTWSTRLMHLDSPPQDFEFHPPNKGITIGGELGSVGWVDLRRGILICDLLPLENNNHSLRFIPLPLPLSPDPLQQYPLSVRNIIVLQGYIKYFEMHGNVRPCSSDTGSSPISQEGWIAATKKIKISSIGSTSGSSNWEEDCTIRCSDHVPLDSPVHAQMLVPNLQEGDDDTKPNLKRICVGYPALSLHDGDVVYLMHLVQTRDPREDKACVIALDMRNKTVQGVANFGGSGRPLGKYRMLLKQVGMLSKKLVLRAAMIGVQAEKKKLS